MSARVEGRLFKPGKASETYPPRCADCGRNATVRETLMGYRPAFLCPKCAKVAREAWASALVPSVRCNSCPSGRLLPGAPGGLVALWTCCDCFRQVPAGAMTHAEAA